MDADVPVSGLPSYSRCRTCGRWHTARSSFKEYFCSPDCTRIFKCCPACGEYFQHGESTVDGFCSAECAGMGMGPRE